MSPEAPRETNDETDELILPAGVNLELTTLDALRSDPFQARQHSERNVEVIRKSIEKVGTGRSIVIDEDNTTLAGNGTTKGARAQGIDKVLIVDAPPDVLVARRVRGLSSQQKLFLAVSDNRSTDLSEMDPQALQVAARAGLEWQDMWTPDEFAPILNADWTPPEEGDLPATEHDKTRIKLTPEQYALVIMVRDIVREELRDSEDVDEAKAIEYACKLFLNDRKKLAAPSSSDRADA